MKRLPTSTEEMFELYSSGLSAAEVAEKVGCSVSTVKARFRREGHSMRPQSERTDRWYENIAKARQRVQPVSSMEERFLEQFRSHGVELVLNHPAGRWNIDLAHIERKIAFEIDSGWHRTERLLKRDTRKDAYLKSEGWEVIRIAVQSRYSGKIIVRRLCRELRLAEVRPSRHGKYAGDP